MRKIVIEESANLAQRLVAAALVHWPMHLVISGVSAQRDIGGTGESAAAAALDAPTGNKAQRQVHLLRSTGGLLAARGDRDSRHAVTRGARCEKIPAPPGRHRISPGASSLVRHFPMPPLLQPLNHA